MELSRLEERLSYQFSDRTILLQALTHTSYGHECLSDKPIAFQNNERLEFLGDAIIDVVVSDLLLEAFPNANEGRLSKMRASVVNEKVLAQVAHSLHLERYMRLGKGETQSGGATKPSILSSAFEALMAAAYLDGGFSAAYAVVRHLFGPFFSAQEEEMFYFSDYKTQLQEVIQAKWKTTPTYHLMGTVGPDHAKMFEVEVRMKSSALARAVGTSKKDAEQNAAKMAIEEMLSQ